MADGWHINEAVLAELYGSDPVPKEKNRLQQDLCDMDIRRFGMPVLTDRIDKEKGIIRGPIVLQITRAKNVSHPKISEVSRTSDGIIRLHLTDGHGAASAIILQTIKGLDGSTPPGTKVLITGDAPVEAGFIFVTSQNIRVLGGHVDALIQKWKLEQGSQI
ncbi:unnamed protein product, partial [Mesorhabditis spiculigera]